MNKSSKLSDEDTQGSISTIIDDISIAAPERKEKREREEEREREKEREKERERERKRERDEDRECNIFTPSEVRKHDVKPIF